ncbi:MAG TPA: hypothetical protein VN973_10550 [Candidatus Dormibacteraeota bacterium]|nr:hypothetical protein [Candidatus Dormibacteraeota bacterium]
MSAQQPKGVHLNGSVPFDNSETVFRMISSTLGDRVRRLPDGETGVRSNWIGFQSAVFNATEQFDLVPPDPKSYAPLPFFIPRAGVDPRQIRFGRLGYADAAKASYEKFAALKREGQIPSGVRFQVSLPTPLAPVAAFVAPAAVAAVEPAYEAALLAELDEIVAAVPHGELAIQWDAAVEFGMLEGVWPVAFTDVRQEILDRLVRIGNRVPADVELGYHLCYGDAGHKHFKEPADVSKLVDIANAITSAVQRPVQWISLPVPRNRTDDAYFAPLKDLKVPASTELYLGLVHITDGTEGTQRRIEAAQRAIDRPFGVATECGLGRRPPETIPQLLRIHAEVSAPVGEAVKAK